jgi:hypothetical protein
MEEIKKSRQKVEDNMICTSGGARGDSSHNVIFSEHLKTSFCILTEMDEPLQSMLQTV